MGKYKDLAGMQFGRLTAVSVHGQTPAGAAVWLCSCECGGTHLASSQSLTNEKVKSCGCLKGAQPAHNRTHNMAGSRLYFAWAAMRNRCDNPNVKSFADYGGRGIKVCERWHDFSAFYADMGERPAGQTLERINNDGDYEPGNCRWATRREQGSNKRNSRYIEANGESLPLSEWARRLGCSHAAILARIAAGMSEADAVTLPIPARPNSRLTDDDARFIRKNFAAMRTKDLAERFGVSTNTVRSVAVGKTFTNLGKK